MADDKETDKKVADKKVDDKETDKKVDDKKAEMSDKEIYLQKVEDADPGRKTASSIEGLETAADKAKRSVEVADRMAEDAVRVQADLMKKKLEMKQAARDAVPGLLMEIDAKIDKVIEEGARVVHFRVPVEKDEDQSVTNIKVDDLIAALTELGYNVNAYNRDQQVKIPVVSGDEIDDEEDSDEEDSDEEVDKTDWPLLVISW